jgi:hypothetical protein
MIAKAIRDKARRQRALDFINASKSQPSAFIVAWLIPVALNSIIGTLIARHSEFQQQYD